VSYFAALLSRDVGPWQPREIDVDGHEGLDELVETMRRASKGDPTALLVLEHEDEWFALVRVDGDEEPRLFVSDLYSASHSHYGPLLAPAADVDSADELDAAEEDDDEDGDEEGGGEDEEPKVAAWAGETDLLEDLGISGRTLRKLVEENGEDPGAVLAEVGEVVGFVELLDALR
jgi:putative tRNA adenosine deaminase-associated protein